MTRTNSHTSAPASIQAHSLPAPTGSEPPENEPASVPSPPPEIEPVRDGTEVPKIRAVRDGTEAPKKRKRKPPRIKNFYWRADSVGFELRRSRDDAYVVRLPGRQWDAWKKQHKGRELTRVVTDWARKQIARRGM